MSISSTLKPTPVASVDNTVERGTKTIRCIRSSTAFLFLGMAVLCILVPSIGNTASYTVNVSLSTSTVNPISVQKDLLATLTTGQYLGKATASSFFANTYSVTLQGRNPTYQGPSVSTTLITMDGLLQRLEATTTNYFLYGYLSGMAYERQSNLSIIGGYGVNCSTETAFVRSSTMTAWSPTVCMDALNNAGMSIYQKYLSTPTIIPGF